MNQQIASVPKIRPMRTLWQQMAGQRLRYGIALLAIIPSAGLLFVAPLIPQAVLDEVLSEEATSPEDPNSGASSASQFVLRTLGGRDFLLEHLWVAAIAIFAITAAAGVFTYLRGRMAAQASERIIRRLRDRLYDHLQHLPISWHHTANTGDLIQRCTSDVETVRNFLATQVVEIGRALAMFMVPLPLMLLLDVRMTVASVVLMPIIVSFSYFFFRRIRQAFLAVDEAEGAMTGVLQENLVGIRVVRAFARQEHEEEKFAKRNRTHQRLDQRLYRNLSVFWSISDLICFLQLAIVIGYGGFLMADGTLGVGTYYWFLTAVNLFLWPMRFMGRILTEVGKATVAIRRIAEVLTVAEESQPEAEIVASEDSRDQQRALEKRGGIRFESVSFTTECGHSILTDVDFSITPGETIALLGPSGSGKSTIVRMLLRFLDPSCGVVRIDGRDIETIPRQRMRQKIAVVLQDPFLFSKTIEENIQLGRLNASVDEIHVASRASSVHDAINDFAHGYQTMVGERGVTLSGGQRQRIALSRALIDKPEVLILDNALSAVDTDTEGWILEALRQRQGSHTTILIAHRLSTLMHADRIFVLENGQITQCGSHEELIERSGLYQRLWSLESDLEIEADRAEGKKSGSGESEQRVSQRDIADRGSM